MSPQSTDEPSPRKGPRKKKTAEKPATSTRVADEIRRNGTSGRLKLVGDPEPEQRAGFSIRAPQKGRKTRVKWLWTNWLEFATVTIFQGEKGSGKSTWMRAVAADITGGPRLPGMPTKRRVAGHVLWFAGEEDVDERVEPCLEAAGADLDLCHLWDDKGEESETLRLPGDADRLIQTITDTGAVMVVIDPLLGIRLPDRRRRGWISSSAFLHAPGQAYRSPHPCHHPLREQSHQGSVEGRARRWPGVGGDRQHGPDRSCILTSCLTPPSNSVWPQRAGTMAHARKPSATR